MADPKTLTLDLPGTKLRYDVRDAETQSAEPVLLMIGYPMAASGFTSLAEHFRDPDARSLGADLQRRSAGDHGERRMGRLVIRPRFCVGASARPFSVALGRPATARCR